MATANSVLRATELNFNTIKGNLITFMKAKPEFADYDFESSALNQLVDVLAYNTYYNAVYTNMVTNEMFLDSAQLRNNVVARAKMLGYFPTAAKGAQAVIKAVITPTSNVESVTIAANTLFTSSIDGIEYKFTTDKAYTVLRQDSYTSNSIVIIEGEPVRERILVDGTDNQRFILANENIDIANLKVDIQTSSSNNSLTVYSRASDLTAVNSRSKVFFVEENENGRHELIFGDGVLGSALSTGNIVIAKYRVVNGTATNGANNFAAPATLGGQQNFTTTVMLPARNGANAESIGSIKFNAPKNYQRQGRAVVKNDYSRLLLAEAPDLQAVSVWGGEENNPPIYGKVYIAAKPREGNLLSDQRKNELKDILKTRNMVSVEPEFVDATFLYVIPTVTVNYNVALTGLDAGAINNKVQTAINNFELSELSLFDKNFRESTFVKTVTDADVSIVSTRTTINMMKRFTPNSGTATTYNFAFNNAIHHPHPGHLYSVNSTGFTFNGQTTFIDDDGYGILRLYYLGDNNIRQYVSNDAGTVNYATGLITLNNVNITSTASIELIAKPDINDINTVRNNIILLSGTSVTIVNNETGAVESRVTSATTSGSTTTITTSYTGTTQTGTTSGVSGTYY